MQNLTVSLSREKIGQMVSRLREFLSAGGTNIKQSHGYEAIARIFGYRNWNTLESSLSNVKSGHDHELHEGKPEQPAGLARADRPAFECEVTKFIADQRWGGMLVRISFRGTKYDISKEDDVLFQHEDEVNCTVYLSDNDVEAVQNEVGGSIDMAKVANVAIQHMAGRAGYLADLAKEGHKFYATSARGAIPAARWKDQSTA